MDATWASRVPALVDAMIDRRLLPDAVMRAVIRRIVAARLREQEAGGIDEQSARFVALTQALADGRDYLVPDDVKSLAVAALAHRVIVRAQAGGAAAAGEAVVRALVEDVAVPR